MIRTRILAAFFLSCFLAPFAGAEESAPTRVLVVNYVKAALRFVEVRDGQEVIVRRVPVALPKPGITANIVLKIRQGGPVTAHIARVCMDCPWVPTANIHRHNMRRVVNEETGEVTFVRKLPSVVAPYSRNKSNPTGVAFLILANWSRHGVIDPLAGLHGTNAPEFVSAGSLASFSCIRNCNENILAAIRFVEGHLSQVRFIAEEDPADEVVRTMSCDGFSAEELAKRLHTRYGR